MEERGNGAVHDYWYYLTKCLLDKSKLINPFQIKKLNKKLSIALSPAHQ